MKPILFIGDVHDKIERYKKLIDFYPDIPSIQVGDFGFEESHRWHMANVNPGQHKVLFGNHDYYPLLAAPHSLGDFGVTPDGIYFVRGAYSVDRAERYGGEGVDFFEEEQLSYERISEAVADFEKSHPEVVVTHECPETVRRIAFRIYNQSLTSNALEQMWRAHKPKLWIFGHHHRSLDKMFDGTRFICLAELEKRVIKL